ncbi:hypothetical protein Igag_0822 [Ignisphaera aggregans DSM 17230]|uniref:Uncharacterized protein n=1 Tax=Ignisphaera aggregans (strain DSM 17230 / JCM 13409 / AQ1.S1) TaxID=583356 RepID=E0STM9_IGNAA|nr:hypothetical protein Igag_0822 [Ignisphaera aggregans DSM 17230]
MQKQKILNLLLLLIIISIIVFTVLPNNQIVLAKTYTISQQANYILGYSILRVVYHDITSIAWLPLGNTTAFGTNASIYFFPTGNYTHLSIYVPLPRTKIVVSDGANTTLVIVDRNRSVDFYLDPGIYIVKYYLMEIPQNYIVIGDPIEFLSNNPIEIKLNVSIGRINITAPSVEEFLKMLGRLIIYGTPDTNVKFVWLSGETYAKIPIQGVLEVYATPDTAYSIYVLPPKASSYIFVGNITIHRGESIKLNLTLTPTTTIRMLQPMPITKLINTTHIPIITPIFSDIKVITNITNIANISYSQLSKNLKEILNIWSNNIENLSTIIVFNTSIPRLQLTNINITNKMNIVANTITSSTRYTEPKTITIITYTSPIETLYIITPTQILFPHVYVIIMILMAISITTIAIVLVRNRYSKKDLIRKRIERIIKEIDELLNR